MLLSTHDVVMILFCVKCSGHVYYYVRKLGGKGGGERGKGGGNFFRAGEQFECLEVGEKFEGLVGGWGEGWGITSHEKSH